MNKTISILRAPVLQACCRRGARIRRTAMLLLATLLLTMTAQTAWADTWSEYITDVVLAGGTESEATSVKNSTAYSGYTWCSTSLNDGTSGDVIYIGYKKSSSPAYINGGYITDFVVVETGSSHNPSSTFSLNGKTYYLCPTAGGDYFANTNHGNLTSRCSGGWNIYLYYTKDNFDDKRAVDGITIYSVSDINDHRSGAINCYNTNGTLKEENISLNRGVSNTPYVYMHLTTVTKTNRPSADPVMASGLVYNGSALQLIKTGATLASGTMYYRLGTSGEWTSNVADIKATTQGYYTVYYYASSTSYCNQSVISESHAKTVTIAMSPNNGVTVSCSNYLEGTTPVPSLGGTNLSTGAVTYKYCTSQNGTYTTTVPVEPGTYWVKATVYGDDNCYDYTTAPVSFTITYNWKLHNSGDTEDDAYVISTTTDLKYLAVWVNAGNNFEGKFFKLGDNIALDKSKENNFTPIGNANYSFSGTFDGQGYTISGLNINKPNNNNVGLFGRANNATIKNLKLDNCTITGKESTGAIVGLGSDNVTITNCRVTNSVTVSGTSYVGGIVGQNANVIGCASAATVSGSSNYVGGIIGNSNSNTIANSLYTGTSVNCSGNNKGAIVGSNTNTTLTVNYYTADLTIGGVNGSDTNGARRAVAINTADGVTVTPTGTAITYNVSGITTYADNQGMIYSDTFYAGATETVSLDIAYDIESFSLTGYTDGNGNTLTHVSDNTYTLTMTANASTVTPVGSDLWGVALSDCDGTAEHPYLITTPAGLDLLASKVNGGTNYSGKYFELGGNITYDGTENNYTPIGTESNAFSGHFDGKGHTVSGININKNSESYKGLFGRIVSAEVKNLTLDNSRIVGRDYCGGISGYNYQGTISNCHVTSSVTIHGSYGFSRYHGGITGYNNQSSIIGCTSGADVTEASNVNNTDQYGGIAGYTTSGIIRDCLVYGGSITSSNIAGTVVGKYYSSTLTNNHYSGVTLNGSEAGLDAGVGDGSQDGTSYICAIIPYEGVTLNVATGEVTTTYDYDGLKIYPTGMSYVGTWYNYIANGDDISGDVTFTATYSDSVPEDYALSGFGYTSLADATDVPTEWAATDGSATCMLCTDQAHTYYIAPSFGDGSQENPYIIKTVRGMNELASRVNSGEDLGGKYFELGADITYDGTENNYTAIGTSAHPFSANFDGKGHTISGININTGSDYQGVFGFAAYCTIQNLTLANSTITNGGTSGGIFGRGEGVTVSNCHVTNTVTLHATGSMFGGIGGYARNSSTIEGCTSAAKLSFDSDRANGGIMGGTYESTIKDCLYLGPKFDTTENGAILGSKGFGSTITNCYHTVYGMGAVEGSDRDGARFAIATGTKPDTFGDATATYGTGTYTGITAYGTNGLAYDGKYYWHDENLMVFEDHGTENSTPIANNKGATRNVVLNGRTLYKDGKWNTISLPFDVDMTDPAGPLYGATYRTVTDASISGTTLNLTFAEKRYNSYPANTLIAGVPYIIKWTADANYVDDDAHNIVNPVFTNVNPKNVGDDYWTDDNSVAFIGTYEVLADITTRTMEGYDVLLMGGDNTLRYAGSGASLGAFRAYFLVDPTKVGDSNQASARLTSFNLDFGDDNATGIITVNGSGLMVNGSDAWYTLDGRRLQGQPTQRGMYINNGRKIVIK